MEHPPPVTFVVHLEELLQPGQVGHPRLLGEEGKEVC